MNGNSALLSLTETERYVLNLRVFQEVLVRSALIVIECENQALNLSQKERTKLKRRAARARLLMMSTITIALSLATASTVAKMAAQRYWMSVSAALTWVAFGHFVRPDLQHTWWFTGIHLLLASYPILDTGARIFMRRLIERQRQLQSGIFVEPNDVFMIRASRIINTFSLFVPSRIAKEDLGDLLEVINRRLAAGEERSAVVARLAMGIWYAFLSTLQYLIGPIVTLLKLLMFFTKK
ncbi:hypothetical protein [Corallococcus sp. AS-1-6]|uniref:hypothetical protein n=1 Tax=Corallococcus sp. AS-1-6 TaxID=2874599 RepID=UPI001CC11CC7|nr:hypothetical protein [Corallococcus sp. AS-1-6]MBZ4373231.1 hypothetical protein [Corallococcus sp. AS-1-6]